MNFTTPRNEKPTWTLNNERSLSQGGDVQKAPVKAGKEQEVQVLYVVMSSDQPRLRVMRRPFVRRAAKR